MIARNVSSRTKRKVAADQKWVCTRCDELLPAEFEVDHILPLFKGGNNHIDNLQALCPTCHAAKTTEDYAPDHSPMHYLYCSRCNCKFSKYFVHRCQRPVEALDRNKRSRASYALGKEIHN